MALAELTGISFIHTTGLGSACVVGDVLGWVGYWPLQDTGVGSVILGIGCPDAYVTGQRASFGTGADTSAMTTGGPGGLIQRSLYFDGGISVNGGTGQYIVLPITGANVPTTGYLRNVSGFGHSIWINLDEVDSRAFIIGTDVSGSSTQRASVECNTSSDFTMKSIISNQDSPINNFESSSYDMLFGNWYHLISTANFPNNTVKHYINGELWLSTTGGFTSSTTANRNLSGFRLATYGSFPDVDDGKLMGYLADYRIYHRELSEGEARTLYSRGVDFCVSGLAQTLGSVSFNRTRSSCRAGNIKSAISNSATNTRAEARAYLDSILYSVSNTNTISTAELDTDGIISLSSIVNVITDSYGLCSLIKIVSSESNTNTSSLSTAQLESLLNAVVNIYTIGEGSLDENGTVLIEGIVNVITSSFSSTSMTVSGHSESLTNTKTEGISSVISELRSLISVLTATDGTATIEVQIDGNTIELVVYITMSPAINPLYINQARVVELGTRRSDNINVNLLDDQNIVLHMQQNINLD